ncbi:MAG: hypothetical protein P8R54_33915 [Myxococcota bacterium]|nr:hypothetical protein [Myxococcota bacterium]
MTPAEILHRQRLIMAVGVVVSLLLPVLAWAMVPVGGVSLADVRQVLSETSTTHGLEVVSLETAPYRALPVWVRWHPVRLLEQRQQIGFTPGLGSDAMHYRLRGPGAVELDCELHSRDGEVLWIRLDGAPEAASLIGPLRRDLRLALPWLPVSSPWK